MRKHDVRKWIHAILDLLPLIVIPVFMVYSHRHIVDNYSVQAEETKVVNFNQLVENGNFEDSSVWRFYLISDENYSFDDDSLKIEDLSLLSEGSQLYQYDFTYFSTGDKGLLKLDYYCSSNISFTVGFGNNVTQNVISDSGNNHKEFIIDFTNYSYEISFYLGNNNTGSLSYFYVQLFNLTTMFGSGNEPSIQQFNNWYPNDYYDFTTGRKELLKTGNYINYDDTDIGSQFFYSLYNTVDHYFNFGNVFNFNQIYDWLNLNVFNGSAPLSVSVVWNVFLYEFLMDLIFLLYALFMFFIDMCTNLIDRFTCQASGGRLK